MFHISLICFKQGFHTIVHWIFSISAASISLEDIAQVASYHQCMEYTYHYALSHIYVIQAIREMGILKLQVAITAPKHEHPPPINRNPSQNP